MSSMSTARYRDVLRLPEVLPTFITALVGRFAYALVSLPLLFAVSEATGSIAIAGAAVAGFGATASFLAPVRAIVIDRYGARPVLCCLVVAFSGCLTAIALVAGFGGPGFVLVALPAVAGVVAPPLGPTMRVAWGSLTPDPVLLRKGLSLDAVAEELLYLAGPAVAGFGLVLVAPGYALLVPAALVLGGGLAFAATPAVGALRSTRPAATIARQRERQRPLLADGRFLAVLGAVLLTGVVSGTVGVAVPTVLTDSGGPAVAGIALGFFAAGSAVGGLLFGSVSIPGTPIRQLVILTTGLVVTVSLLAIVSGGVAVSLVLGCAGLFFSPVLIVAYLAANLAGGSFRQNAATTWVNTGHNVGAALGSALAGILVQAIR
jgi:hypothetical protein